MSNKIITLEITEKEYEYYSEYCKLFNTNCEEDLIEYLRARSEEAEKYITKNNEKTDNKKNISKSSTKLTSNSSQNSTKQKYISHKGNRYYIRKWINGVEHNFGSYETLEEAVKQRDFLIKENWDEQYAKHMKK